MKNEIAPRISVTVLKNYSGCKELTSTYTELQGVPGTFFENFSPLCTLDGRSIDLCPGHIIIGDTVHVAILQLIKSQLKAVQEELVCCDKEYTDMIA